MNKFKEHLWVSISTIQTNESQKGPQILCLIYVWPMINLWRPKRKLLNPNINLLLSSLYIPVKPDGEEKYFHKIQAFASWKIFQIKIVKEKSRGASFNAKVYETSHPPKNTNWLKDVLLPESYPKHCGELRNRCTTTHTHSHMNLFRNGCWWCC